MKNQKESPDSKTLVSLYKKLLLIRLFETKIVALYPEQQMRCPVHLCIGQEAIAAGVCETLRHEDIVFSNHRSHGHYLAKGGDAKSMAAELYGKETGCSGGRGGSMHLIDLSVNFFGSTSIVAGTIPVAVGAALSIVMRKQKRIVAVFFGDGAIEQGTFHESLNFAALKKLPILFVCENNFYAVNTPIAERQPNRAIKDIGKAYGIESFQADGNDVSRVFHLAKQATDKIREGTGPVFLEFQTYRWMQHCGPDFDHELGCRPKEEFLEWKKKCCKGLFAAKLLQDGVLTAAQINEIEKNIQADVDAAFEFAKKSEFPDASTLPYYLFSVKKENSKKIKR